MKYVEKQVAEKGEVQPASRSSAFSFNLIDTRSAVKDFTFADVLSQRGFDAEQFYRVNARGNAKGANPEVTRLIGREGLRMPLRHCSLADGKVKEVATEDRSRETEMTETEQ